jgi:hypothetical protein
VVTASADPLRDFSGASEFGAVLEGDGCRVLFRGWPWWSFDATRACGRSAPERLEALNRSA